MVSLGFGLDVFGGYINYHHFRLWLSVLQLLQRFDQLIYMVARFIKSLCIINQCFFIGLTLFQLPSVRKTVFPALTIVPILAVFVKRYLVAFATSIRKAMCSGLEKFFLTLRLNTFLSI